MKITGSKWKLDQLCPACKHVQSAGTIYGDTHKFGPIDFCYLKIITDTMRQ